ncbi:MAG TPA: helix-turn-helix domain-containing protein [Longimicrobium sp.]|nr:helix-turn-helix domain-containing protein [Longimicrobium sp.]
MRERLLQAALRVFQEGGTRGATTRRIAAEAGVNEITLFRHFGSKAALLQEALQASARADELPALPAEPADPERELVEWARGQMAHLRRSRQIIRACMGEMAQDSEMGRRAGDGPERVARDLEAYLVRLRERRLADAALDPVAAAAMLMGALFTDVMGRDLMPGRYTYAPEEAPERYVGLFLRAIGAPAPRPSARPRRARVAAPA